MSAQAESKNELFLRGEGAVQSEGLVTRFLWARKHQEKISNNT